MFFWKTTTHSHSESVCVAVSILRRNARQQQAATVAKVLLTHETNWQGLNSVHVQRSQYVELRTHANGFFRCMDWSYSVLPYKSSGISCYVIDFE